MTLSINLTISDGIVMASDSLLTLINNNEENGANVKQSLPKSQTVQKAFLIKEKKIGLVIRGVLTIKGLLISKYMNDLIRNEKIVSQMNIDNAAITILNYFKTITKELPDTALYISGFYKKDEDYQRVCYFLNLKSEEIKAIQDDRREGESSSCKIFFGGNYDTTETLLNPNEILGKRKPTFYGFPFHTYSIEDAVDFCKFLIDTESNIMKYSSAPLTVGGDANVIILTPDYCEMRKFR